MIFQPSSCMFICTTCKRKWPGNYCLVCARAIARPAQQTPPKAQPRTVPEAGERANAPVTGGKIVSNQFPKFTAKDGLVIMGMGLWAFAMGFGPIFWARWHPGQTATVSFGLMIIGPPLIVSSIGGFAGICRSKTAMLILVWIGVAIALVLYIALALSTPIKLSGAI